ncbi:uncharacterized protein IWZ02DRAFT_297626 [Phyllosticta citriasiana]|uniref:Uncharacterized protein n=1 Tax=Phyllosticta citriasiana TaxID=595635 RepID=A0ABR1KMV5_9PEZI
MRMREENAAGVVKQRGMQERKGEKMPNSKGTGARRMQRRGGFCGFLLFCCISRRRDGGCAAALGKALRSLHDWATMVVGLGNGNGGHERWLVSRWQGRHHVRSDAACSLPACPVCLPFSFSFARHHHHHYYPLRHKNRHHRPPFHHSSNEKGH